MQKKAYWLLLILILADMWTKSLAQSRLGMSGMVPLFQNWHGIEGALQLVTNRGAAWGILSGCPQLLIAIRALLVGALLATLHWSTLSTFRRSALLLIAAGAIGNLLDPFLRGHVIDFIRLTFWGMPFPTFNLADLWISLGAGLLLLSHGLQKARTRLGY